MVSRRCLNLSFEILRDRGGMECRKLLDALCDEMGSRIPSVRELGAGLSRDHRFVRVPGSRTASGSLGVDVWVVNAPDR